MTKADQELAVQGLKRIREVAKASGITVGPEVAPGEKVQSDEEILAFIKETVAPIYHAAATCTFPSPSRRNTEKEPERIYSMYADGVCGIGSMGHRGDRNAVVDTQGKVYDVVGLRVVDASIFPLQPPGHPQATVCEYSLQKGVGKAEFWADMLAEKIASDILAG